MNMKVCLLSIETCSLLCLVYGSHNFRLSRRIGVLNRNESLAFNLGAKLTGSRLLKAMEGAFEGPITTTPPQNQFTPDPVTWLDIVDFAKSHPQEFQLSSTPSGLRYCQFPLKNVRVEIGEDDWRLIVSGALDRFRLVPPQPLEEDETAELATVEILEQRLQVLIKKADEVARRARQLNYHLSGRKASIHSRYPPQTASSSGFQPVNAGRQLGANPGYDLHADLLQQFTSSTAQPPSHRVSSVSSLPPTPNPISTASSTPRTSVQQHSFMSSTSNRPSPGYVSEPMTRDVEEENRILVTSRIEKMARGDVIRPPCDRCRRLKTQCIKHLTACQGCTKKHTRCTWKKLTGEEVALLRGETSGEGEDDEDELKEGSWKASLASVPQLPGIGDLGVAAERGAEAAASRPGPMLVVGRQPDDMWRKGPSSLAPSRDDSMDIDSSSRQSYPSEDASNYTPTHDTSLNSRMRQVASAASAHADATARENQRH